MTTDYENLPRTAGKRGLRLHPPIPEMQLANFRATAPAPPPPSGDVSHGITAWGMDGNDQFGCCGWAMSDHYVVAKTGDVQRIGTFGGGISCYFAYGVAQGEVGTPPAPADQPDEGVDPPTWFGWLMDQGLIEAWAELKADDADEVHAGMLNFGGIAVALDLNDSAESEFEAHQPWHLAPGEKADPNKGHFVLGVKYDPNGETFVTWAALQAATLDWDASCIVAVYVFVTKDDAARNGVDIDKLKAACLTWGGTVRPPAAPAVDPPMPGPAPQPPTPLPESHEAWWEDLKGWFSRLEAWAESRGVASTKTVGDAFLDAAGGNEPADEPTPLTLTTPVNDHTDPVVGSPFGLAMDHFVAGGTEPYRFEIRGSVPAWLKLTEAGALWGTPDEAGTVRLEVSVSDSGAPPQTGSWAFDVTIGPAAS